MTDPLSHTPSLVTNSTDRASHYAINKPHLPLKLMTAEMLRSKEQIRHSRTPQFCYKDHQIPQSIHQEEKECRLVLMVSLELQTQVTPD